MIYQREKNSDDMILMLTEDNLSLDVDIEYSSSITQERVAKVHTNSVTFPEDSRVIQEAKEERES